MMATLPPAVRTVSPSHRFKKIGSEEVHTIESYERKVHGTPYSDPKREFSTNQYTERRTYGRDENGEVVVKIEKDPKEPVRPVSPVRPVTPVGGESPDVHQHLLKPLPYVDTLPLHIPRPKSTPSPRSQGSFGLEQQSPRSALSFAHSPRSGRSSGFGSAGTPARALSPAGSHSSGGGGGVPMKKVIRKSRLVSIHDGRPVSPYVETVTYEPAVPVPAPRTTILRDSDEYVSDDYYQQQQQQQRHRQRQPRQRSSFSNRSLHYTEDMETIPLPRRTSNLHTTRPDHYDRDDSFYGTASSMHRHRVNNLRNEVTRTHSDPVAYGRRTHRSHSTHGTRPARTGKTRDEGAYIIENPLYHPHY